MTTILLTIIFVESTAIIVLMYLLYRSKNTTASVIQKSKKDLILEKLERVKLENRIGSIDDRIADFNKRRGK